ncbi:tetratricopeptide repeat-containing sensor histidine kinase [Flavobacterium sedimenticola]|uniref:Tetratricopeptide repeat protein n=1 Tax=Flavobacterium sedimenticola TaxID=3043286 RepID=A0ABT6XTV4_9FLAO|nr:tetratricopeptide repeat protein [Flavobacterium sedimenticola]MDI9258531.1 tetratricopeptide repeat protein [Flavobacterium sedimenticola]
MKIEQYFLLCCLSLFAVGAWSQNPKADSLISVLKKTRNDIDKVQLLNAIADEYKTSHPKLMSEYAQQAYQLAQKINFEVAEGNALLNLGNANIITGDYPKALRYFTEAQHLFETLTVKNNTDKQKGLAKALGSIGIIFSEQSNYSKALEYYLKAVKIYEQLKDDEKCAKLYNNIGIVYKSMSADFKALEYFIKAQKIQEKRKDVNVGITYTNIGNSYLSQKNLPNALNYYNKAKIALDRNPNPRALGEWYNNFGLYHKASGNPAKAIENWNSAIRTFQSIDDKFGIADSYIYLGQLYLQQNKLAEAMQMAQQSLTLAKEIKVLEQIVISEKLLSDIYSQQNNTALALQHFKRYSEAKDSLTNEENIRRSVEEELVYDFEKREAVQQKEIEKRDLLLQEESKRNTLQLFFAAVFGLLLFGIAFLIYNRIQLKKNLTLQKELAEYEQKALHLQMNPHFVFNCLGSISSFIVQNGTDSAIKYLSKFSKLMRLTLEYSKESLIPIHKEIESLQNYLELEQLRFNNKFNFTIYKSSDIEDDMALPPLLMQPFVENAIIHGVIPKKEIGSIAVRFSIANDSLICTIEDNGIGFQESKAQKINSVVAHKSMALDITKKRLEMIESATKQKTDFSIEETKNKEGEVTGTKVTLQLPIQYVK